MRNAATDWTLLEGGVTRQLHVSRKRIASGHGLPLIIEQPDGRVYAARVKIEGSSELIYSQKKIPGGARVYIETDAPLRVFQIHSDEK